MDLGRFMDGLPELELAAGFTTVNVRLLLVHACAARQYRSIAS
jgi:hypothetical protein